MTTFRKNTTFNFREFFFLFILFTVVFVIKSKTKNFVHVCPYSTSTCMSQSCNNNLIRKFWVILFVVSNYILILIIISYLVYYFFFYFTSESDNICYYLLYRKSVPWFCCYNYLFVVIFLITCLVFLFSLLLIVCTYLCVCDGNV